MDCILQATTRILTTDGILALSTNRVAREAGVSIGSLYQYFPGKEALLSALVERKLQDDAAYFMEALAGYEDWPAERKITELIAAGIRLHRRDRRILKVMFEQLGASGQMERVRQLHLQLYEMILAMLGPDPQARVRAYVYAQSVLGIWHSQVDSPWCELDEREVAGFASRMILRDFQATRT